LERSLASAARISNLVAALLVARGIKTPNDVDRFLNSNLKTHLREPHLLPGCKATAEILLQAVKNKKKIVIYGDYDVDGITGIVILYQTLTDLGGNVHYYIPNRLDEGYGLNSDAVGKLAKDGANLIITVDCGIGSCEEAETAKRCGVALLITDHHTPDAVLPDAAAITHPQLVRHGGKLVAPCTLSPKELEQAEKYPFPFLCGSAVALKIAWAVGQLAHEGLGKPVATPFRERLKEMLGLAAMATVADFVPLLDENRALVRGGLPFLVSSSASSGLKELLAVTKFEEKNRPLNSEFVAFQLAPRINAVGRLGQAEFAVELLTSKDQQRTRTLAAEIDRLNEERKTMERRIAHEAEQQVHEKFDPGDPAFVLAGDWHRGVIGIVAGRLVERFHRPVVLLGTDKMGLSAAVGSARSVSGFNLYDALKACEEHLVRFGGHGAAAGLTVETSKIETFRKAFCAVAAERISEEERIAELMIDGFFPLGAFTPQAVQQVYQLAPFGSANPSPIFAAERVAVGNVKTMGREANHFAAEFSQGGVSLRGIAFHRSEWVEAMQPYDEPMDITFKVKTSDYNGRVELDILDWRRT
jgi:single-stranded-DNA-specific exonuclease